MEFKYREKNQHRTKPFCLIILIILHVAIGDTEPKPKKRKPTKKRPANLKNRAYCLTCLTDFKSKSFDQFDTCLNPLANLTDAELRYFNMCPESAQQCMVEIATVNGVFVGLERRCTTSCSSGCSRDGYGAENENCIYCCPPYAGSEYFDEEAVKECPIYPSNNGNILAPPNPLQFISTLSLSFFVSFFITFNGIVILP